MKIPKMLPRHSHFAYFLRWVCIAALAMGQSLAAAAQNSKSSAEPGSIPPVSAAPGPHADPVASDSDYIIGIEDILAINVWHEAELSRVVPVRPDGKISLPLIGEVQANGQTPVALQQSIAKALESYVSHPQVTVIVQEVRSKKFNVVGQVLKPGSFLLSTRTTILDGLAGAGGFRDFAKRSGIYVLRVKPDGSSARLPFNYKKVIKGKNLSENVLLQPGDTIVVP